MTFYDEPYTYDDMMADAYDGDYGVMDDIPSGCPRSSQCYGCPACEY